MKPRAATDDAPIKTRTLDMAQQLPSTLVAAAVGTATDVVRSPGLILTKEQLINLKRYEIQALALPTVLSDVIWYLGYETGAGKNLEATDFQRSFRRIHEHAKLWNPLRSDLMIVGSELGVFADQMQVYESGVQHLYDTLRAKPQDSVCTEVQADFVHYIQRVTEHVLHRHTATHALKGRLDEFARQLSTEVLPTVQLKLRSIDNNNLPQEIRNLNATINGRADHIEQKQREYKVLVNKSAGINFALIGLGIYNGAEADKIRKTINALRIEQEASIALLENKNKIHGSLQRVRNDLQDLGLITLDADITTQNLAALWSGLHIYFSESVQQASRIDSSLSLRRLMNGFRLVAQPWREIKINANKLLNVFKDADREFRRHYGHQ